MRKEFMIIASIVAATFANDARIEALGGSSMFDDASFIYSNPAYVTDYKIIQGNITTFNKGDGADETVGSAIGTWHMSDKLVLGGYFNQNINKVSLFNNTIDTDNDGNADYPSVIRGTSPHLLVGLKLSDEFSLGIDAGFEHSNEIKETGDRKEVAKTSVMSLDLGANMELGSVALDASVGIAIPSEKATDNKFDTDLSDPDNATVDTTLTDIKGMELDIEAYATIDVNALDVTAGVNFNTQKVEDQKISDTIPQPKELNLGIVAGVAKEFEANFTLGLEAQVNMTKSSNSRDDDSEKETEVLFIAAAEKEFGQTKLFDSHTFRLAYAHDFMDSKDFNDTDPDDIETKYDGVWGSDVGLSAGFGVTRGKFGLDLYVSNVDFDFNGNDAGILQVVPVAGASLTIDFAEKGSTLRNKKGATAEAGNGEW